MTMLKIDWLDTLRAEARAEFDRKGLPTARDEQWKYTRTSRLEKQIFDTAPITITSTSKDVTVIPLRELLSKNPEKLEKHIGKISNYRERVFDALNLALMQDGYFIHIPAGKIIQEPIEILFSANGENKSAYIRNIIVMEEHSFATVIERYQGVGNYFNNVVTEISLGNCVQLEHYKIQKESLESSHIASMIVQQAKSSRFVSHSVSLGGGLVRNDIVTELVGEDTECELNGLYMAHDKQHVDYHTVIDHIKPKGTSRENYRGIVNGNGRAVFNGKIVVHPDAQKTNAQMQNKNLLLSKTGEIDTQPELQIDADDVKCSHGATVGQLSDESLFYLRSRGIEESEAKKILTVAFAKEIIDRMKLESIRTEVQYAI